MRGTGIQGFDDTFDNAIHIAKDIVVPKAQHQIALGFENRRSFGILLTALSMLAAVKFNN